MTYKLIVNVGKSTGVSILSSAAGIELAPEGIDNLPNGVFTYSIAKAMNKYPTIKINELKNRWRACGRTYQRITKTNKQE